jgi:hypothetical protein
MSDGHQPTWDASSTRGSADSHRADLKQKSDGISRRLGEEFAYLTHGTASLEEANKLLTIITNIYYVVVLIIIILLNLFELLHL